jgi:hypothetical protein
MYYIVTLLSGGAFAYIWAVLLMQDINAVSNRRIFPVRILTSVLVVGFLTLQTAIVFMIAVGPPALGFPEWLMAAVFVVAIPLATAPFVFITCIWRHLYNISGIEFSIKDAAITTLLTVPFWSFMTAQRRINLLVIESGRELR